MSGMTATTTTTVTSGSLVTTSPVWRVGAIASITGAIATEVLSLGARVLDIPMNAADPGADAAKHVPVGGFAMAVLLWAAVGVVLAAVFARRAARPARTFAVTTVALTVLSLGGPIFATHTETATKVVLLLAHLVAAAIVIPPLTRRLAHAGR